MEQTRKNTTKIGDLGENIAIEYLKRKGFVILDQNYLKSYGEVDVIASKNEVVHFVEVKTVTHETREQLEWSITHETWRPEEQVHARKLHQIEKALETWIFEHKYAGVWQIDVLALRIVPRETYSVVNWLQNITEA